MPDENNARTAWIPVPSPGELPAEVASEIGDAARPRAWIPRDDARQSSGPATGVQGPYRHAQGPASVSL
jgi:hypothetical protein